MEISLSLQQESKLSTLEQFREYDMYTSVYLKRMVCNKIDHKPVWSWACQTNGWQGWCPVVAKLCGVWQTSDCCQRQCAAMLCRVGKPGNCKEFLHLWSGQSHDFAAQERLNEDRKYFRLLLRAETGWDHHLLLVLYYFILKLNLLFQSCYLVFFDVSCTQQEKMYSQISWS